ncbi:MAG: sel1 repeat family protein [Verrucomicrobia bacterium]|nr:sel1 repeat family protein [Verrucomicrobiota bacterium]
MNTLSFKTQVQPTDGFYIKTIQEVQQKLQTSHSAVTRIQAAATSALIALRSTGFLLISPLYLPITFVVTLVRSNLKDATHNLKGNLAFTVLSLQRAFVFPFATVVVLFSPNLYNRMIPSAMRDASTLPAPIAPLPPADPDAPPSAPPIGSGTPPIDVPPSAIPPTGALPLPGAPPHSSTSAVRRPEPLLTAPFNLNEFYQYQTPKETLDRLLNHGSQPANRTEAKALIETADLGMEQEYAAHLALLVVYMHPTNEAGKECPAPPVAHILHLAEKCEELHLNALALAFYQYTDHVENSAHLRTAYYYLKSEQYPEALRAFEDCINMWDTSKSNPMAAFEAAQLLRYAPEGITKDIRRAAALYEIAVEYGHAAAKVALASMHLEGEVTYPNIERAATLLQEAHAAGNEDAAYSLGLLHMQGHGVRYSREEAMKFLAETERKGYGTASYLLALLTLEGASTPFTRRREAARSLLNKIQDDSEVKLWLAVLDSPNTPNKDAIARAIQSSFAGLLPKPEEGQAAPPAPDVAYWRALLDKPPATLREEVIRGLPGEMPPLQKAAVCRLALVQALAAGSRIVGEQEVASLHLQLAEALRFSGNLGEAFYYYHLAAEKDNAVAQLFLGCLYAGDRSFLKDQIPHIAVFKDAATAERFLRPLAAEVDPRTGALTRAGHVVANRTLALLLYGTGYEDRSGEATPFFKAAADQGDILSCRYLAGIRSQYTHVISPDDFKYLEFAANARDARSQWELSFYYEGQKAFPYADWSKSEAKKTADPTRAAELKVAATAQGYPGHPVKLTRWWIG